MRLLSCILPLVLLAGCQAPAGKTPSPELTPRLSMATFCETQPCRKNQPVKFRTESGEVDQVLELYWPVVQGQDISILPGEELLLEIHQHNQQLTFTQVTAVENPAITLKLSLQQMENSLGMMLSVYNPLDKPLKFQIQMIDFLGRPHKTSSCPVLPGRSSYESWPHPIPELLLTGARLLESSAELSCI